MPKLIGSSSTVVEIQGLKIDELAGNVATQDDTISIAYVTVSEPTAEPWLTLDYDEWLCVRKGKMVLYYGENDESMVVNAGETCFVAKGERFRPVFPEAPTEYVPVCLPAFRPDRCHREEGDDPSDVTNTLLKLHKMDAEKEVASTIMTGDNEDKDILYHMCEKPRWDEAVKSQVAYFPTTFEEDGFFTHATAVPQRLMYTANHFYQSSKAEWICLRLSRSALTNVGIITKDEDGLPVGDAPAPDEIKDNHLICPHIYGGIPTLESLGILTKIHPMVRNEKGEFLYIAGVTN
jgi:mannose-6-phosphate isomerase-like protein (cupin superfamily)